MTDSIATAELKKEDAQAEVQFREAVATLTSLLNHEICRPLSTILSNAQILLKTAGPCSADTRTRLEAIEDAARVIRQAARDLAATARAAHDLADC